MIGFILSPLGRIGGVLLILASLYSYHSFKVRMAYKSGRNTVIAEQAVEAKRRFDNAEKAGNTVRDCARDPSCIMRRDENQRD